MQYEHADPFMYQRSSYYGNYAVPVVAGDGRSKPSPWSVDAMESDFAAHSAGSAPLRMKVSEVGYGEFAVSVAADEDVADARLCIAAVLSEDVPSSSGTSFLPYHVKTFLTPVLGDPLSLSAGDSVSVVKSFTVDPAWDYSRMGVAAWVQTDGGENPSDAPDLPEIHGVLQAAFSEASATGVPDTPMSVCRLSAPVPNPCRGDARLTVRAEATVPAELRVYDPAGRRVATLMDRTIGPGTTEAVWDGRSSNGTRCPSGVYFVRLSIDGDIQAVRKLVLVR